MRLAQNRIGRWLGNWRRKQSSPAPEPEPAAERPSRVAVWISGWLLAAVTGSAAPASAELEVKLSRPVTGRYESVGISVTDPLSGLDVKPGPLLVTMADSRDHRQTFTLDPTGKPGEWYGRFTPVQTGRYTGTVILDRENQKDIGLVPLVRVNPSSRPGFLRQRPGGGRSLAFTSGASFFPVGVRLQSDQIADTNWREVLSRLRRSQLNYVAVTLPVSPLANADEQRSLLRSIDGLLIEAEQHGYPLVQLQLASTEPVTEENLAEFQSRVEPLVRRWSHSTALAAWELPAEESAPNSLRSRIAETIRTSDRYGHLLIGREGESGLPSGIDLSLAPSNWQQPGNRRVLMEASSAGSGQSILPGEDTWQMLVLGGIGLPLPLYNPDRSTDDAVLNRLSRLMEALRSVPYHATAVPFQGIVPVDTPGSFCRYGSVLVGWMAPEKGGTFELPSLPRGRYRVQFWNPATDQSVSEQVVWSDGAGARIEIPSNLQAVFLKAEPVASGTTAGRSTAIRRTAKQASSTRKVTASSPSRKKAAPAKVKASRKPVSAKPGKRAATRRASSSRTKAKSSSRAKRSAAKAKASSSRRTVKKGAGKKAALKKTAGKSAKTRAKKSRTSTRKRTGRRR